ncbi:unnamed protein product, partial [Ectocarpus sp. 12 AP-2014]
HGPVHVWVGGNVDCKACGHEKCWSTDLPRSLSCTQPSRSLPLHGGPLFLPADLPIQYHSEPCAWPPRSSHLPTASPCFFPPHRTIDPHYAHQKNLDKVM